MTADLVQSLDAKELRELASRVQEHQAARGYSDNQLLKRYSGLGSTKTYKRILTGDLLELDLERQLANYRAVVALIEATAGAEDGEAEPIYDDLHGPARLRKALLETFAETGIARFILLEGDTGSGKTSAFKSVVQKYGQRILVIEATVVWADKPNALLGEILANLGVKYLHPSQVERFKQVLELLRPSRRCIVIDEGHHMGPRCLNTVKSIINQTQCEVLVCAKETLWRKLEREAYDEARQLTGNRLAARITLAAVHPKDVERMLTRRLQVEPGDVSKAVAVVTEHAKQWGRLAFVREVCKRASRAADGDPVTLEIITGAVAAEVAGRRGQG